MVQKDRVLLSVVVAVESWELRGFFGLGSERGMHVTSHLLTQRLIIFLQGLFWNDQTFEFIGEGMKEVVDFIGDFLGMRLILPKDSRFENGYDF